MEKRASRSVHDAKGRFSRNGATAQRKNMNTLPSVAPLRRCVKILLLILVIAHPVYSQDLSNLEESVRDQTPAAQAALAAAAKSPPTALSEEYGKLGQLYHA